MDDGDRDGAGVLLMTNPGARPGNVDAVGGEVSHIVASTAGARPSDFHLSLNEADNLVTGAATSLFQVSQRPR